MKRLLPALVGACAGGVLLCAAWVLGLSMGNPIRADLAMLHYSGFLMQEKGFLLYRDILEINFPAPYLLHQWLGAWLGYDARPLRWLDGATMVTLGGLAGLMLRPLGRAPAVAGPALFMLFYMIHGAEYTLERDYLLLLPIAAAFVCATHEQLAPAWRAAWIGVLVGLACSLKPNAIVAAPALYLVLWLHAPSLHSVAGFVRHGVIATVGFLLAFLPPFVVIYQQGVLDEFLHIYQTFLPIYVRTRYDLYHYSSETEYWTTLAINYVRFGGTALLLSAAGLIWAGWNGADRRRLLSLGILSFAFTLYEVIAGKFWTSHLIPTVFWTALCLALLLVAPRPSGWRHAVAYGALCVFSSLALLVGTVSLRDMQAYRQAQIEGRNLGTQVGSYLQQQQLAESETVQIMDLAGDGQAALLLARATISSRFLLDAFMFLRMEHPVTHAMREDFLVEITQKKPAFIVYFERYLHPGGGNRLREFTDLYALVSTEYVPEVVRPGEYVIYRRKDRPVVQP